MTDPLPGRASPAGRSVVPGWTRLAAVLLLACPAWSAEDAQGDGGWPEGRLEEFVTTATKKSQAEAARDVPVAVWVKPAKATKTAKSHRVPLSRQALQLLVKARQGNRDALVFPGARPGAMLRNSVMAQALRTSGIAASGHGFRSSSKDWARQHDVDELLSEFALAPVEGSATVAAYARDDLLEKRRSVMQRWADCISLGCTRTCPVATSEGTPANRTCTPHTYKLYIP